MGNDNMNKQPLAIRTNKNSRFILEAFWAALLIILLFSIYQSIAHKNLKFNALQVVMMIGLWCLLIWLEKRRFKTIYIYEDHIIIKSKSGQEEKFITNTLYLNIVNWSSRTARSNRTLQLRKRGTHKKVFSIEPIDWKDDLFLEDKLRNVCKIKVDNWVQ